MKDFSFLGFLWDKVRPVPPVVKTDLSGKNVVVIGANTGIGLEAAKHFASMNPRRLILGCRNEAKGQEAVHAIKRATGYRGISLWLVDLNEFSSVVAFADKFEEQNVALDIVVANAGIMSVLHEESPDGWERTLQVNYLSTVLLSLLLLPRMKVAATNGSSHPRLVIVSSDVHAAVKIPSAAVASPNILRFLNTKESFNIANEAFPLPTWLSSRMWPNRYAETKLLEIFFAHALTSRLPQTSPIIVDTVHPGWCNTSVDRQTKIPIIWDVGAYLFARTAEQGGRSLVFAAIGLPSGSGNKEDEEGIRLFRGAYISTGQIEQCCSYALSQDGKAIRERLWGETMDILSEACPKLPSILKSLKEL